MIPTLRCSRPNCTNLITSEAQAQQIVDDHNGAIAVRTALRELVAAVRDVVPYVSYLSGERKRAHSALERAEAALEEEGA